MTLRVVLVGGASLRSDLGGADNTTPRHTTEVKGDYTSQQKINFIIFLIFFHHQVTPFSTNMKYTPNVSSSHG